MLAWGEAEAFFCDFAHVDESDFGELIVVAAEEADGVLAGVDVLRVSREGAQNRVLSRLEFHEDGEVTVTGETGDEEITGGVGIEALLEGEGAVGEFPILCGELVLGEVGVGGEVEAG